MNSEPVPVYFRFENQIWFHNDSMISYRRGPQSVPRPGPYFGLIGPCGICKNKEKKRQ